MKVSSESRRQIQPAALPGMRVLLGRGLAALTMYGVLFAAFFAKSFSTGGYIAPSDNLDMGMANFLSPRTFWTEGMYSGFPIAADSQALTWYPMLHALTSFDWGWNVFIVLPYVFASLNCFLFVYVLCRSFLPAFFAGLVFGFGGSMMMHINHFVLIHSAAWIPLLPLAIVLLRNQRQTAGILIGSLSLCLMLLAGHPQLLVYNLYFLGAYAGFTLLRFEGSRDEKRRFAVSCAGMVLLGIGLAAIQAIPTFELASLVERSRASWELYTSKALHPAQLLTVAFPVLFGSIDPFVGEPVRYMGTSSPNEMTGYLGILPLFLVLWGTWTYARRRPDVLFWCIAGFVYLLLCVGDATPLARLFYYVPFYDKFRVPARHFFLFGFTFAVAAGLILAAILRDRASGSALLRRSLLGGLVCTTLAAGVMVALRADLRAVALNSTTYQLWALAFPLSLMLAYLLVVEGCSRITFLKPMLGPLLLAVLICDLSVFHYISTSYHLNYARVKEAEVEPHASIVKLREELRPTGGRILAADGSKNAYLRPNLPRAWDLAAASGTSPLKLKRYGELAHMGNPGDVYERVFYSEHQAMDLLSIVYVIVPTEWPLIKEAKFPPERWTKVTELRDDSVTTRHFWVLRNERVLPRAWFVRKASVLGRSEVREAIHTSLLPDGSIFDPRETVLVKKRAKNRESLEFPTQPDHCGRVSLLARSNERVEFSVEGTGGCILALSQIAYPGWQAFVDGERMPIVEANYALMAIAVPAGSKKVVLEFHSGSILAGMTVSAVSAVVWFGILIGGIRRACLEQPSQDKPELAPSIKAA